MNMERLRLVLLFAYNKKNEDPKSREGLKQFHTDIKTRINENAKKQTYLNIHLH